VLAGLPVEFVGSFPDPHHPLEPPGPEIAFLGRSNVGKSSLLNALLGRRVARVSSTPGKTQFLNAYRVGTGYFVDLPGYGWARASKTERSRFRRLVHDAIARRTTLTAVVWLLDIRHAPSEEDRAMQELLFGSGKPTLVVLTKGDKLSRTERLRALRSRAEELGVPVDQVLATSSSSGEGIVELAESIQAVLEGER
jgi:GTP-binding protein